MIRIIGCGLPALIGLIGLFLIFLRDALVVLGIMIGLLIVFAIIKFLYDYAKKESKEKEFVCGLIILAISAIGVLYYQNNSYPYIFEEYDYDKVRKIEQRMIKSRHKRLCVEEYIFADVKFEMTPTELLRCVRKNNISNDIFFKDRTKSSITIADSVYDANVEYKFNEDNELKGVVVKIKCSSWERGDVIASVISKYGDKYMHYGETYEWVCNNLIVVLYERSDHIELNIFNLSEEDNDVMRYYKDCQIGSIDNYFPWRSTPDEGRDTTVCLSYQDMLLGGRLDSKTLKYNNVSNLKTEKFENLALYSFDSWLSIKNKRYKTQVNLETINDSIGVIKVMLKDDIYDSEIVPLYASKYGKPHYNSWTFANQGIELKYNSTPNSFYHYELKKTYYTGGSKFNDIRITYTDFRIYEILKYQKSQKVIYDKEVERIAEQEKYKQDSIISAEELRVRQKQYQVDNESI